MTTERFLFSQRHFVNNRGEKIHTIKVDKGSHLTINANVVLLETQEPEPTNFELKIVQDKRQPVAMASGVGYRPPDCPMGPGTTNGPHTSDRNELEPPAQIIIIGEPGETINVEVIIRDGVETDLFCVDMILSQQGDLGRRVPVFGSIQHRCGPAAMGPAVSEPGGNEGDETA